MSRAILFNILLNNLVTFIIHISITFILLLPLYYIWSDFVWLDGIWERRDIAIQSIAIGIYTIIALTLFFLAGRRFLTNTHSTLANFLSVIILPGIIILSDFLAFSKNETSPLGILAIPILPISETISFFLRIEPAHGYMVMSLLPPLTMWLGLVTKRSTSGL